MHLHILGICGAFMGGLAAIARQAGHTVTGCDANVYPPMSEQLSALGIELIEGYEAAQLDKVARNADVFVVGNAITRENPLLESILDSGRPYTSGPQWLSETVLREKWVLAVAGTHGKTTTTALLAWILDQAGLDPGFLIGGVALDFGVSARLADGPFFVIEADEYDTAFSDKRSKFVHYRPRTAILNNLEYDHADIFPDLAPIETHVQHLVCTIPRRRRGIRRLRASSHRDRGDAGRSAPLSGQGADPRRARAALEHDEARHDEGRACGQPRGRRSRVLLCGEPELGRRGLVATARRACAYERRSRRAHRRNRRRGATGRPHRDHEQW